MFTASFDERRLLPAYFQVFLQSTLIHTKLLLITRAKAIKSYDGKKISLESFDGLTVRYPAELPCYTQSIKLFEKHFVNYSTNKSWLEQLWFNRWFALNAATSELDDNDYVCLLDSDLVLGSPPDEILKQCNAQGGDSYDIIAEWTGPLVAVGPEITIIRKQSLFEFCRFLVTNYYSPSNDSLLRGEYFDRIGRGLPGGVGDMRALACWMREGNVKSFNLNDLTSSGLIGNLNMFISKSKEEAELALEISKGKLRLLRPTGDKTLIGIHFQGHAKIFMHLVLGGLVQRKVLNISEFQYELSSRKKLGRRIKLLAKKLFCKIGLSVPSPYLPDF